MRRTALTLLVAIALAAIALVTIADRTSGPVRWTPDGLFYQARSLELSGTSHAASLQETFGGPLGARLRQIDPERSGDPDWVSYAAQFYERRVAVPAAAAAIEPLAGERAILDLSIAGYLAAILAIFGLLLLRFSLPIAAAVALATIFLPALTFHAGFPLTDSWGLALETAAFACGAAALQSGRRWLIPWAVVLLVLAFTRDSFWIPILAAAWIALRQRSSSAWWLLGSGIAAVLPALLLFSAPMRELLAMMLNGLQPAPEAGWGFIAERYPAAVVDLLRADGGFVRDGELYSAVFLLGGLLLLFALTRGTAASPLATLLRAGVVAGVAYVLVVPIFSAFRLELALVPMAAFGLGAGVEWAVARIPALSGLRIRTTIAEGPRA